MRSTARRRVRHLRCTVQRGIKQEAAYTARHILHRQRYALYSSVKPLPPLIMRGCGKLLRSVAKKSMRYRIKARKAGVKKMKRQQAAKLAGKTLPTNANGVVKKGFSAAMKSAFQFTVRFAKSKALIPILAGVLVMCMIAAPAAMVASVLGLFLCRRAGGRKRQALDRPDGLCQCAVCVERRSAVRRKLRSGCI